MIIIRMIVTIIAYSNVVDNLLEFGHHELTMVRATSFHAKAADNIIAPAAIDLNESPSTKTSSATVLDIIYSAAYSYACLIE